MPSQPLAVPQDVADLWRPFVDDDEEQRVGSLIRRASARLRHAVAYSIDDRVALYTVAPADPWALDPQVVADVVATIVKRFLTNPDGAVATSQTVGPYSQGITYVTRAEKTTVPAGLHVTDGDLEQLKPAPGATKYGSIRLGTGQVPYRLGHYGTPVALEGAVVAGNGNSVEVVDPGIWPYVNPDEWPRR